MPISIKNVVNPTVAAANKYISEFLGTFTLVFFGTLAVVVGDIYGELNNMAIGLVFGLVVMAMIFAFGQISGAHINPAVTIAFWLGKEFPTKDLMPYISAQIVGALTASSLVCFIFPTHSDLGSTLPHIGLSHSFVIEVILSLILMLVIFHVAKGTKEIGTLAGIAIGATVALEAMVCGPLTGASMNPARSIGPAILSGQLSALWIYLLAPIIGMIISIPIWKLTKLKT